MELEEALQLRRGKSRLSDIAEQYGIQVIHATSGGKINGRAAAFIVLDDMHLPEPPKGGEGTG